MNFMKPQYPLKAAVCWLVSLTTLAHLGAAPVDPSIEAARKILAARQDSVLWISGVCKVSYAADGGSDDPVNIPDQERKVEALGTVISTNGMIVTALSGIDPAKEISGREIRTASGTVKLEASSVLKEVKIIMPDGAEVPAEVVMKDVDLDLAFLLAKSDAKEFKDAEFKAVDLKDSASVAIADEVVSISRADEVLNRQPMVFNGQVNVLVKKPREFIRASSAGVGTPTFDLDGKLVGIGVVRSSKERRSIAVLLPAGDVEEIAVQARAAVKTAKPAK
jgi:S1-C subfamily serine protease